MEAATAAAEAAAAVAAVAALAADGVAVAGGVTAAIQAGGAARVTLLAVVYRPGARPRGLCPESEWDLVSSFSRLCRRIDG